MEVESKNSLLDYLLLRFRMWLPAGQSVCKHRKQFSSFVNAENGEEEG